MHQYRSHSPGGALDFVIIIITRLSFANKISTTIAR